MREATKYDKEKVVDILSETFDDNPGVNWMLRKRGDHKKKIRSMVSYAFIKALVRNGVFISSNEKGVALCYKYNLKKITFIEFYFKLKFVLVALDFKRIIKVLKRESYREGMRPQSGEYFYFWFLGVLPEGRSAAFELNRAIMNKAKSFNIPIYLETSIERNHRVYERVGFKTYNYWEDTSENIQFWFMKWEPEV